LRLAGGEHLSGAAHLPQDLFALGFPHRYRRRARAAAQFLSLLQRQLDPLTRHDNFPIWHADNIIRTTCL
jgi:hypothetical protein